MRRVDAAMAKRRWRGVGPERKEERSRPLAREQTYGTHAGNAESDSDGAAGTSLKLMSDSEIVFAACSDASILQ